MPSHADTMRPTKIVLRYSYAWIQVAKLSKGLRASTAPGDSAQRGGSFIGCTSSHTA